MTNIVRLQKILVLMFGVLLFCSSPKVVYAQSFWSIYDEEEAKKQKEAEEKARAEEQARKAQQAAARQAELEAKRKADQESARLEAEKMAIKPEPAKIEAAAPQPAVNSETSEMSGDVSAWFTFTPEVSEEKTELSEEGGFPPDSISQDNLIQDSNQNQKVSEKAFDPLFATGMFIAPVLGISGLQDPFTVSVKLGCEFIDTAIISPFFVGGGFLLELGFPKEDFPYQYKVAGSTINSPNLFACTFYAPVGIMYSPFENKRIQLEMAARLGLKLLGLVSFDSAAASQTHCAFYTAMLIGVDVYNIHANVDISYDSVGGFSPGLTVSYRFKLGSKRRNL